MYIYIYRRIKELIITAGGENIPPVLIEDAMKAAMLAVSNCMVRVYINYTCLLIYLDMHIHHCMVHNHHHRHHRLLEIAESIWRC
jgi:long-subunit acyl-CoA synthetase (AMP-forming)